MKSHNSSTWREYVLKPLIVAAWLALFVVLAAGAFSTQFSFSRMREALHRKFTPDHERKLTPALLAELRNGGFTLFIRHASRDGTDAPASSALDWAYLIDADSVPADFRWGICLNELGRVESRLLGHFLRKARIPVGEILSSPLCRARETAELSIGRVDRLEPALLIVGKPTERANRTTRLRKILEQPPGPSTNRLLFSHTSVLETLGYDRLDTEQAGMVVLEHHGSRPRVRAVVTLREMWHSLFPDTPS